MKVVRLFLLGLAVAVLMHLVVFKVVEYSYCNGRTLFVLQPFYPVYSIRPFGCEYKQVVPVISSLNTTSIFTIYYDFRDKYMVTYTDRNPPFKIVNVGKTKFNSFKNSDNRTVVFKLFLTTTRKPVKKVITEKSGDCDDFSTVLYTIYKNLGYDSYLILVKLENKLTHKKIQHEVLIVRGDNNYYLIDPVNDFFLVLKNPNDFKKEYEGVLLYYRVLNYWVFGEGFLPRKCVVC